MKKFGILFIALVGLALSSFAQSSVTTSASSTATIVKPLALTNSSDLAFGKIAVTAAGVGPVTIDAAAAPNRTAGGSGITLANGIAVSSAKFTLTGEPSTSYLMTFDATATLANGGNNMIVTLSGSHAQSSTNTIPVGGTEDLYIGGSLAITAGQASGPYTGAFNVTIAYN